MLWRLISVVFLFEQAEGHSFSANRRRILNLDFDCFESAVESLLEARARFVESTDVTAKWQKSEMVMF